jgi:hypothetical protein
MRDEPHAADPIAHLYRQGIDEVLVSCERDDDVTYKALVSVTLPLTTRIPFDQAREITSLAKRAAELGATWVIPFDADEYWCGAEGTTIRETLESLPVEIQHVYAPMYLYLDRDRREVLPKPLPKIAFKPYPAMSVNWGNHSANDLPGLGAYGPLIVREIQYRDWDHFLAKIETNRRLHAQPHMQTHEHGSHMWRLCQMSETQLQEEWAYHLATATITDPIP